MNYEMTVRAIALASAFEAMSINIELLERNRYLSGKLGPSINNMASSLKYCAGDVSSGRLESLQNQLRKWSAAEADATVLSQSDDVREQRLGNLFMKLKPQYESFVADLGRLRQPKSDANIDRIEEIESKPTLRKAPAVEAPQTEMKMELDGYELWNAAYELKELSRPTYKAIVFTQDTEYSVSISAVGEKFGDVEELGSVDGMIRNADGISEDGLTVAVSEDTFLDIVAELWNDVEIGSVDHGVVSVLKVDENGLSELEYDGIALEAEDLFPSLPSHVANTLDEIICNEGGFNAEATSMTAPQVTPHGMEFDVELTYPDQIFSVSVTKTTEDGKPRYVSVIECDIPEANEELAHAVKMAKGAASAVAKRYCRQAEAKGFDQDFTKIHGAVIKMEKPPIANAPPPPLSAPGERKPSGRSISM